MNIIEFVFQVVVIFKYWKKTSVTWSLDSTVEKLNIG